VKGNGLSSREQVTELLRSWGEGDLRSDDRLSLTLYQELRRLARHQLRRRPGGVTLDTTGLIHDAYVRLVDASRTKIRDRAHFLALSSRIMRQIVVDHVRHRNATKRGSGDRGVPLVEFPAQLSMSTEELLALDQALEKLKTMDPRAAQLVDLRFFGGVSTEESAELLDVSIATIKRDWERTRAFLYKELKGSRHDLGDA
jgi:RNA polymerase sigma-70 factor (ECF subfamily)